MNETSAPYEIVGVGKDTKYGDLREEFRPLVYTAIAQYDHLASDAQILIRSNLSLSGLISAVKSLASEANPNLDLSFVPFHKMIEDGLLRDRLMARLSGFFGLLASCLPLSDCTASFPTWWRAGERKLEFAWRWERGHRRLSGQYCARPRCAWRSAKHRDGAGVGHGQDRNFHAIRAKTCAGTFLMALAVLSIVAVGASLLPEFRAASIHPMACLRNH